jgi:hypothetical protein
VCFSVAVAAGGGLEPRASTPPLPPEARVGHTRPALAALAGPPGLGLAETNEAGSANKSSVAKAAPTGLPLVSPSAVNWKT